MSAQEFFPFVLIVGPTASGKSSLAFELAKRFKGAILNCDSLQVYQRLDIGTAKPPPEEMKTVPHLMFDILKPGEILTAGDFRKAALKELERELKTKPVIGVGGSGFYIQALEKGMFESPKADEKIDSEVRAEADAKGLPHMYKELETRDPEYAEDINPNDSYRILRGLVIIRQTGKKVSELRREFKPQPFPFPLLKMGLIPSREELLPRIEARVRQMLDQGFLKEVQTLKDEGFEEWPPMHSVGYKECLQFLNGEIEEDRLIPLIVEKTSQLAKKQRTWFKRDSNTNWLNSESSFEEAERLIEGLLDRLGQRA